VKQAIFFLYSLGGLILPVVAFAVAALVGRGLMKWFALRWYWQYLAVVIVWSTANWSGQLLLNSIGQRIAN
jgi:hypothetical protein